jgi:hypothetical protein
MPFHMFCIPSSFWEINVGDILTGILMPFLILFIPLVFNASRTGNRLKHLRTYVIIKLKIVVKRLEDESNNIASTIEFLENKSEDIPGYVVDMPVDDILTISHDDLLNILVEDLKMSKENRENRREEFYALLSILKDIKHHFQYRRQLVDGWRFETNNFMIYFQQKIITIHRLIIEINKLYAKAGNKTIVNKLDEILKNNFDSQRAHKPSEIIEAFKGLASISEIFDSNLGLQLKEECVELQNRYFQTIFTKRTRVNFAKNDRDFYKKRAEDISEYLDIQKQFELKTRLLRL